MTFKDIDRLLFTRRTIFNPKKSTGTPTICTFIPDRLPPPRLPPLQEHSFCLSPLNSYPPPHAPTLLGFLYCLPFPLIGKCVNSQYKYIFQFARVYCGPAKRQAHAFRFGTLSEVNGVFRGAARLGFHPSLTPVCPTDGKLKGNL